MLLLGSCDIGAREIDDLVNGGINISIDWALVADEADFGWCCMFAFPTAKLAGFLEHSDNAWFLAAPVGKLHEPGLIKECCESFNYTLVHALARNNNHEVNTTSVEAVN